MQTDQLNGLIALKIVSEKRNFTLAAQVLGVSPSAISQGIKLLEQRLGCALLSRTTRSTCLTEAGERFIEQAGPALDQILSAMDGVGRYASKPSGTLKINLSRGIYATLAPLFTSFSKKYPEVTLELFFDDDLSDVVGRGFDAGIRLSEMMAKDVVALKLMGPVRFVTAATPEYFQKRGRPKHPKDLLAHSCIRLRVGENDFYDHWEFESKGKDFQVKVSGNLIINDTALIVAAGLQGNGIIYHAEDWIQEHVRAGRLEIVLKSYAAVSEGFYLYFPKRSQVMPKLRAFIEHVQSEKSKLKRA